MSCRVFCVLWPGILKQVVVLFHFFVDQGGGAADYVAAGHHPAAVVAGFVLFFDDPDHHVWVAAAVFGAWGQDAHVAAEFGGGAGLVVDQGAPGDGSAVVESVTAGEGHQAAEFFATRQFLLPQGNQKAAVIFGGGFVAVGSAVAGDVFDNAGLMQKVAVMLF